MAEMDDLTGKQITEAAILQLINHWLMEYKPEATVDPASNGVPTGKAVANYVKKNAERYWYIKDMVDDSNAGWVGLFNDEYVRTTSSGRRYLRLRFETVKEGSIINGMPPLFNNSIYEMPLITTTATYEEFLAAPPSSYSTALVWIFMNDEDNRITYLYRYASFFELESDKGKYYLWISPLRRAVVKSGSVQVNIDPTDAQKTRCILNTIYIY